MSYPTLKEYFVSQYPSLHFEEEAPLSKYTTFKIGGPCPLMIFPSTTEELLFSIKQSSSLGISYYIVGNGSNLLVSDHGVNCLVIHTKRLAQVTVDAQRITVESGVLLGKLAHIASQHNLSGLEFAHGIPGSVGGAIVMNAGAYGGEMSQVVESVTSYDFETDTLHTRSLQELDFSYRHSLFSHKKEVILSATLQLQKGDTSDIIEKMNTFAQSRKEKQPLNFPSCGSTFKRPPNHFAAALIDQCALKGVTVGGAQVSQKHAGFIVNIGNATSEDVMTLVEKVKEKVEKETGISLELEVQLLY